MHARRIAAFALAILVCLGPASAQAAGGAVVYFGAHVRPFTWTEIGQGGVTGTYTTPGGQSRSAQGALIRDLLRQSGVELATVTAVTVAGRSLTPIEIGDLAAPPEGLPALFALSGGSIRFAVNASDLNAPDAVTNPAGQPLDIRVQSDAPAAVAKLHVTLVASTTHAAVGQPVAFVAQIEGAPPGAQLAYSWAFTPDGSTDVGASVSHSFAVSCDCQASVTVSDGQGDSDIGHLRVTVGHPHRRASGSGLGDSNAIGSGSGGSGTGQGGSGGPTNTGARGVSQPARVQKARVKPTTRPGAAAKPTATPTAVKPSRAVRGVLLADVGSPLEVRLSSAAPSGRPGAAPQPPPGAGGGFPALAGGLTLALAVAALGGISERRRGMLRPA